MSGAAMISRYDPYAVSSWCSSQNARARSIEREAAATATAPGAYAKSSTTLAAIRPGPTMPHLTSAAPFMPLTLEPPDPDSAGAAAHAECEVRVAGGTDGAVGPHRQLAVQSSRDHTGGRTPPRPTTPGHLWFRPGLRGTPGASYVGPLPPGSDDSLAYPTPADALAAGSRGGRAPAGSTSSSVASRGRLHGRPTTSDPALGTAAVPGGSRPHPRRCRHRSRATSARHLTASDRLSPTPRVIYRTRAVGCGARSCTPRVMYHPRSGDLVSGRRESSRRRSRGRDGARCRPRAGARPGR